MHVAVASCANLHDQVADFGKVRKFARRRCGRSAEVSLVENYQCGYVNEFRRRQVTVDDVPVRCRRIGGHDRNEVDIRRKYFDSPSPVRAGQFIPARQYIGYQPFGFVRDFPSVDDVTTYSANFLALQSPGHLRTVTHAQSHALAERRRNQRLLCRAGSHYTIDSGLELGITAQYAA